MTGKAGATQLPPSKKLDDLERSETNQTVESPPSVETLDVVEALVKSIASAQISLSDLIKSDEWAKGFRALEIFNQRIADAMIDCSLRAERAKVLDAVVERLNICLRSLAGKANREAYAAATPEQLMARVDMLKLSALYLRRTVESRQPDEEAKPLRLDQGKLSDAELRIVNVLLQARECLTTGQLATRCELSDSIVARKLEGARGQAGLRARGWVISRRNGKSMENRISDAAIRTLKPLAATSQIFTKRTGKSMENRISDAAIKTLEPVAATSQTRTILTAGGTIQKNNLRKIKLIEQR